MTVSFKAVSQQFSEGKEKITETLSPGWANLLPIATRSELAMEVSQLVTQKNCQISH